jgi:hypothetical protein
MATVQLLLSSDAAVKLERGALTVPPDSVAILKVT